MFEVMRSLLTLLQEHGIDLSQFGASGGHVLISTQEFNQLKKEYKCSEMVEEVTYYGITFSDEFKNINQKGTIFVILSPNKIEGNPSKR